MGQGKDEATDRRGVVRRNRLSVNELLRSTRMEVYLLRARNAPAARQASLPST
jgi:hypothetical protein